MTRPTTLWAVMAAELATAAAILLLVGDPRSPAASRGVLLCALGLGSGALLFALLAYPARPGVPSPGRRRLLPGLVLYFGGRAFAEEVVWRVLLYGSLAAVTPRPVAGLAAAGSFACAHAVRQGGRGLGTHLVTGSVFTALYATTHSLLAAGAAHAAYNVLVASSLAARKAAG